MKHRERDGMYTRTSGGAADTIDVPLPPTLRDLARICEESAIANGWDPCTWDNLPGKLMMLVTELDEAQRCEHDLAYLHEEIADATIRLLAILHGTFNDDWSIRVQPEPNARGLLFAPIEVLIWPTLYNVCQAANYWRKDNREDARISLEYALRAVCYLAERLGFDLTAECLAKIERNKSRGKLHGNARSLG